MINQPQGSENANLRISPLALYGAVTAALVAGLVGGAYVDRSFLGGAGKTPVPLAQENVVAYAPVPVKAPPALAVAQLAVKYTGIVLERKGDALSVALPGVTRAGGDGNLVTLLKSAENAALRALVPKTNDELYKEAGMEDTSKNWDFSKGLPPPLPPPDKPYKDVAMSFSDFQPEDMIEFVTFDSPFDTDVLVAGSITWLAKAKLDARGQVRTYAAGAEPAPENPLQP